VFFDVAAPKTANIKITKYRSAEGYKRRLRKSYH